MKKIAYLLVALIFVMGATAYCRDEIANGQATLTDAIKYTELRAAYEENHNLLELQKWQDRTCDQILRCPASGNGCWPEQKKTDIQTTSYKGVKVNNGYKSVSTRKTWIPHLRLTTECKRVDYWRTYQVGKKVCGEEVSYCNVKDHYDILRTTLIC